MLLARKSGSRDSSLVVRNRHVTRCASEEARDEVLKDRASIDVRVVFRCAHVINHLSYSP